ncbi:hypothetical protein D3C74_66380 [compost metagenome]
MPAKYDRLYLAYLIYFNRDHDYFECHEVMEELWLKQDRDPVLKGLLQVAVGLFHFRNGNIRGGLMMLQSAREKLQKASPEITAGLGIDLIRLLSDVQSYIAQLERLGSRLEAQAVYEDMTIHISDERLQHKLDAMASSLQVNIPQQRVPQRGPKHEERLQVLASRESKGVGENRKSQA